MLDLEMPAASIYVRPRQKEPKFPPRYAQILALGVGKTKDSLI